MIKMNPILKVHVENLEETILNSSVNDEGVDGFNEGVELAESEKSMDSVIGDVNGMNEAIGGLQSLQEAQEKNIQMMETGIVDDSDVNVNSAVMSSPLPSDADGAVEVIGNQIKEEEMVVESIASSLGFKSKFGNPATKQLYKCFGIRKSERKNVHTESRYMPVNVRRQAAIDMYKAHCEGIGDAVKKMGSSIWDGIKKMIKAIIDFVKKISNNVANFIKKFQEIGVRVQDIIDNPDKYKLTDVFTKGYSDISPQSVFAGCVNHSDATDNALLVTGPMSDVLKEIEKACGHISSGEDQDFADSLDKYIKIWEKELMGKIKKLQFDGVEFDGNDTSGIVIGTSIFGVIDGKKFEAKSVNIKFANVKEIAEKMKSIVDAFDKEKIKELTSRSKSLSSESERIYNILSKLDIHDNVGFFGKVMREQWMALTSAMRGSIGIISIGAQTLEFLGKGITK